MVPTSSVKQSRTVRGGGVSFKKMFEEVLKNTGFYFLLPLESYCLVVLVGLLEVTVEIQ